MFLDHECIGQPKAEPIDGEATITQLRSFIVGRHDHDRAELLHESVALTFGERRRCPDIETHLGPGVGPIGVLSARPATRPESPFELMRGDANARRDPQRIVGIVHGGKPTRVTLYAGPMTGNDWIIAFAAELGIEPLDETDVEALLDLAGVAAHASERLAAPLTCYLAAKAGISPTDALARARAMAGA